MGPYREQAAHDEDPDGYLVAWKERDGRRHAAEMCAAALVVGLLLVKLAGIVFMLAVIPLGLLTWRTFAHWATFACPRCGRSFGVGASHYSYAWTKCCLHCGLADGTPEEEA